MANILNPALEGKFTTNKTTPIFILPTSLGSVGGKKIDLRHIDENQAEALVKAGWDGLTKVTVKAESPKSPSQYPASPKVEAKESDVNKSKAPSPGVEKEAKSGK